MNQVLYLISIRLSAQRIFRRQHGRGYHDADENHVAEVIVIAEPMAEDSEPETQRSKNRFFISIVSEGSSIDSVTRGILLTCLFARR